MKKTKNRQVGMNDHQPPKQGFGSLVIALRIFFLIMFLAALAVPPWEHTFSTTGTLSTRPAGHHFILLPPSPTVPKRIDAGVRISMIPYAAQIAITAILLGLAFIPSHVFARRQ